MKGDGSLPPAIKGDGAPKVINPFEGITGISPTAIDRNVRLLTPEQAMHAPGIKGTYAAEVAQELAGTGVKFEVAGTARTPISGLAMVRGDRRVELPINIAKGIWYKGGVKYGFGREQFGMGKETILGPGQAILSRARTAMKGTRGAPIGERLKAWKSAVDDTMRMTAQQIGFGPTSAPGAIQHYIGQGISYGRGHPLFDALLEHHDRTSQLLGAPPQVFGAGTFDAAGKPLDHSAWSKRLGEGIAGYGRLQQILRGDAGSQELRAEMARHARWTGIKAVKITAASEHGLEIEGLSIKALKGARGTRVIVPTTTPEEFATGFFPDLGKSTHQMRAPGILFSGELRQAAKEEAAFTLFTRRHRETRGRLEQEWFDSHAAGSMPENVARNIRRQAKQEARAWLRRGPGQIEVKRLAKMRMTGTLVRSAFTDTAEAAAEVAAEHMGIGYRMGKVGGRGPMGKIQLGMNMSVMALAPDPSFVKIGKDGKATVVDAPGARIARRLLEAFGDSSAIAGSPMAVRFAGMNQKYGDVTIDLAAGMKGRLNPIIQDLVEVMGARGQLDMRDPEFKAIMKKWKVRGGLTQEHLTRIGAGVMEPFMEKIQGLREGGMWDLEGIEEGVIGVKSTSLGKTKYKWVDEHGQPVRAGSPRARARVPAVARVGRYAEITGIQVNAGGRIRLMTDTHKPDHLSTRLASSLQLSMQQRIGLQAVGVPETITDPRQFIDLIVGNIGGEGLKTGRRDFQLRTAVDKLYKEGGGSKAVERLVKGFEDQGITGLSYTGPNRWSHTPTFELGTAWMDPDSTEFIKDTQWDKAFRDTQRATGVNLEDFYKNAAKRSAPQQIPEHYVGEIAYYLNDQVMTPEFSQEVKAYQAAKNLPQTGKVDKDLVRSILKQRTVQDTVATRATQPMLGKTGSLRVRLDDLRGAAAMTYRLEQSMPEGKRKAFRDSIKGWQRMSERKVLGASRPWRSYMGAVLSSIGQGPGAEKVQGLQVIQREMAEFNTVSLTDWRARGLKGPPKYTRGMGIEQYVDRGLTETDPLTGKPKWTEQATRITISKRDIENLNLKGTEVGRLALDRMGKEGMETMSVIVPAGAQMGQQLDETVRLKKSLQPVHELLAALQGNDLDEIWRANNAVSGGEGGYWQGLFGKKGAIRGRVFKPERSMVANIGTLNQVKVGHAGVSLSDLKRMGYAPEEAILAQGATLEDVKKVYKKEIAGRGEEALKKLRTAKGGSGLFMQLKTEPARDPFHFGVYKAQVIPESVDDIDTGLKKLDVHSRGVVAMNSLELSLINRDKDYDMVMAYAMADKRSGTQFLDENATFKRIWEARASERNAINRMERTLTRPQLAKWQAGYGANMVMDVDEYTRIASLDADDGDLLKRVAHRMNIAPDSKAYTKLDMQLRASRDQGVVGAVGEFTGLANVRWRQATEIAYDLVEGRGVKEFGFADGMLRNQQVNAALDALQNNKKDLHYLFDIAKASENAVLKKGKTRAMFKEGNVGAVHMADPFLHAMWVAAGQAVGTGEVGEEKAAMALADAFQETLSAAQGNPLTVAAMREDDSFRAIEAAFGRGETAGLQVLQQEERKIAERAARAAMPISYLTHGQATIAGKARDIRMRSSFEMMRMADPNYDTARSFEDANLMTWGRGLDEKTARVDPRAFMDGGQARKAAMGEAADQAVRKGFMESISPNVKRAADAAERAARKIWDSKGGRIAVGAGLAISAWHLLGDTFRGEADLPTASPGEAFPAGAPMPPTSMMDSPAEGNIDYGLIGDSRNAYVERTPGVRTHLQIDGQVPPGQDFSFMEMADDAFGTLGIQPLHTGRVVNDREGPLYRHQVDAEIHNRMRSRF